MLELRPNCECCDCELPPDSAEAYICSYECTFCENCVNTILMDVCPNCGGHLTKRPIRPEESFRPETGLKFHPASSVRVHSQYSVNEMRDFSEQILKIRKLS